jgi:GT2 family glycosyltransferase
MPPIGIVIVTYNSEAVIGPCLDAAQESGAAIVVVDNASSDGTRAAVVRRGVNLLTNDANLGFAKAVNQGFAVLDCPYVLLLNPDAVLSSSLEPLREACDLPGAAGAGGMLQDPKGKPQAGFMVRQLPSPAVFVMESLLLNRLWPGNPINIGYRGLRLDYTVQQRVQQPAGAFLLIRRAVWEELGGFDERFWPLWFEDVDFCRRAIDRGYCFYYVPSAVAIHTGAHSIPALKLEMRRVYWYRSLLGYAAKHFRPSRLRAVCLAVITGAFFRAVVETAFERSLRPFATYGKVAWLASRLLIGERSTRV